MRYCALFVLIVLWWWQGAAMAAGRVVVAQQAERQGVYAGLTYWKDEGGHLDLSGAMASRETADWTSVGADVPNLGFTQAPVWFHVQVQNAGTEPLLRLLEIGYALLDRVDLFVIAPDASVHQVTAGSRLAFSLREIPHRHLLFPLTLPANTSLDLYIRVESAYGIQLPMALWQERAFWIQDQVWLGWQFLYYGLVVVMVLYNLFLAWGVRDRIYLYYVLMVACVGLFQMVLHGVAFQYLWPDSPRWNNLGIAVLTPLCNAFSSLFSIGILRAREHFPRYYAILMFQVRLAPLQVLACFFFPVEILMPLFTALVVITATVVCCVALPRWRSGGQEARYFLIAWNVFLVGCLIMALNKFGVLPYNWLTENTMQIGSGIETILLSLALATRINNLREGRMALEREQLASRRQALAAEARAIEANYESKAKSDFLAVMSHEIRTPMNGVLGMLELLRDTPLNERQNELVATVQSSGKLLLNIINDILDFSKIEAGRMELENIRFSLRQTLGDALAINAVGARQKGLLVAWYVDPALADSQLGDPSRIKQVLYNLFTNAIKFTHSGHIFVRVKVLENGSDRQSVRVDVQDSGIGMTAEQRQRLFTPFTQADTSTSRKYGGTGLGLAISRKLVEAMGGSLTVDSVPQRGSTFRFELTLQRAEPTRAPVSTPARQRLQLCSHYVPFLEWVEMCLDRQCFGLHGLVLGDETPLTPADIADGDGLLILWRLTDASWQLLQGTPTVVRSQLPEEGVLPVQLKAGPVLRSLTLPLNLNAVLEQETTAQPLAAAEDPAGERAMSPALVADLRVLVAEDNPVNQMVIRELLRPLVGEVDMVGNGREALEKFRSAPQPFDLIFMDCEMPELDGYETTLRIRALEQDQGVQQPVRVVALTAHAFDEFRQKAFAAGMTSHLSKPITRAVLRQYLEEEFGCRRAAS